MGKFHFVVIGKGAPLIFLPACGFTGIEGLNIAEALADEYESHLLDLPGAGQSLGIEGKVTIKKAAEWLKEYIDEHGFEKVVLAGHSMGVGIAMCFADLYPDRVSHMIMIDYGHKKMSRFPVRELGPLGVVFPLINLLDHVFGNFLVKQLQKRMFSGDDSEPTKEEQEASIKRFCERFNVDPTPEVRKAVLEEADFSDGGFRLMIGLARINYPKLLRRTRVPTLLIYSTFESIDKKTAKKTKMLVQRLVQSNPRLHAVGLDGHHYLHWERPETLKEIKSFLGVTEIR